MYILSIETSTAMCSVALSRDGELVCKRSDADRKHASLTSVFCKEVLDEAGVKPQELSAVCLSDGPGSYTGLRVGLSTAKGLCFGAGIKLLSVSSLDVLSVMAGNLLKDGTDYIVPMIDARRMEVYTAVYDAHDLKRLSPVQARVIDGEAFADIASRSLFIGDGALKCRGIIQGGEFAQVLPSAAAMSALALSQYEQGNFRDVAYFEPFYLKEFVATVSKKNSF